MQTWSAPASWCSCTRARDRVLVAPGDERVDEAVAAAVGEVVVGEAEPHPVVRVVRQAEVDVEVLARDRAALVGGRSRGRPPARARAAVRAERLAGRRGVLGR